MALPPVKTDRSWIKENWDKVLAVFFSAVISGVIGFFAAIFTVKDDLARLRDEITKLQSEGKLYETKEEMKSLLSDIDQVKLKINDIFMPTLKKLEAQGDRVELNIVRIDERSIFIQQQSKVVLEHQLREIRTFRE